MFAIRDFVVLAYTNGMTHWFYKLGDSSPKDVTVSGYFGQANDMVAIGDVILATGRLGAVQLLVTKTDPVEVAVMCSVDTNNSASPVEWALDSSDSSRFVEAITNPPEPNDALKTATERHRQAEEYEAAARQAETRESEQ